ncbi:beta-1,4 xylanase [Caulobacter phage Cr30]|uniref:beta-1,4 xylanase n=1 Tax=Caulobacter phage Cr30 TaxID=1357714 RepID=UPI0004A9B711|nr:beta-1,4 xylanase [Caulobacter phage Cr30]AGS80957.1 beta-1,4 xylanase [Caulobacter phage Cr30]
MLRQIGQSLGKRIPRSFFGMHLLHPDSIGNYGGWTGYPETPIHDLGYGSYRIWDNDCTWRALEPSKGSYYWTRMDQIVDRLEARGLEILYTMGQPPPWATGGEADPTHINSARYNGKPPENLQDWRDYVTAVATRYAGRIGAYELWNEIDLSGFWTGTEAQMIELVQEASTIIRAIDPNAIVCSPSISRARTENAVGLLARVCAATVDDFDVVSIHPYNPTKPFLIDRNVQFMRSFTGDKPIWSTEFFNNGVETTIFNPVDEMDQAGQVVKTTLLNWVGGAERCFWYQLGNPNAVSHMVTPSTPANILLPGHAYKHMANLLSGGFLYGYRQTGRMASAELVAGDGRLGRVLWANHGATLSIDLSGFTSGFDVVGETITLSASYNLTPVPIYVFI